MVIMGLIIAFILMLIGGAIFGLMYIKSAPKKEIWTAYCYQVGDGVKKLKRKNEEGEIEEYLEVKDLIPYMKDILVKKEYGVGRTSYELKGLKMTTNAVTADMVEKWSKDEKIVHVFIDGTTGTIMKRSFDSNSHNTIFTPMPRERIEMVISEISSKQSRLKKDKTNLATFTGWVFMGMAVLGFIAVAYFSAQSMIKVSENIKDASAQIGQDNIEAANIYRDGVNTIREAQNQEKSNNLENYKKIDENNVIK